MSVINLKAITEQMSIGALAIGNFDGVHLGHQELLKKAIECSDEESGVLTFSPHPREFFDQRGYLRIFEKEENFKRIKDFGVSKVFVESFDERVSELSAKEFLSKIFKKIHFKTLVIGFDFKLGKGRGGDYSDIKKWCDQNAVSLIVVPCRKHENEKNSSSLIKDFLLKGNVKEASKLLGVPYSHSKLIRSDQGIGKQIGFPTLNIHLSPDIAIERGVYSTVCLIGGREYNSISNIGFRPTVSNFEESLILETHILDEDFNSLGESLEARVVFKDFIRSEKKFSNLEGLKDQIKLDIIKVKSTLN